MASLNVFYFIGAGENNTLNDFLQMCVTSIESDQVKAQHGPEAR